MQKNDAASTSSKPATAADSVGNPASSKPDAAKPLPPKPIEIGGPSGLEPTRYGDWERNGRVSDF
ncbi:MAG: succinate dehydrogenase assembly factor 4 [Dongiaceae bacterium]